MKHEENKLQKDLVAWFRNLTKNKYNIQFGNRYELLTQAKIISNVNEIFVDNVLLKYVEPSKYQLAKQVLENQRLVKNMRAKASGREDGEADLEIKYLHPIYNIYTFLYIELKTYENYYKHSDFGLNENQKQFKKECEIKNIPYYICCTPQMFIDILLENKIIKKS